MQNQKLSAGATAIQRIPSLDIAKFVSALAVVWIHACQSNELSFTTSMARFAVPFFAATSAYAMVQSLAKRKNTWLTFSVQKWKRLYLPFAMWTAAYLLFKISKRVLLPEQECDLPGIEVLWQGGAYHLWFIPFLLGSSILLYPCLAWALRSPNHFYPSSVLFALVGLVIAIVAPIDHGEGAFGTLVAQALPSLLWGAAIGLLVIANSENRLAFPRLPLLIMFAASSLLLLCNSRETLLENAAGCSLFLWALAMDSPNPSSASIGSKTLPWWRTLFEKISWTVAWLGNYALGIYFCHLMILKIGEAVLRKAKMDPGMGQDVGLFVATALAATLVSYLIAKQNKLRWLVC